MATTTFTTLCFYTAIDNNSIPIFYAGAGHLVAAYTHKKSGRFITDQLFIQVVTAFHVIICRGKKACSIGCFNILLRELFCSLVADAS